MSIKDALKKAGFNATKGQNEREHVRGKVKKATEKHQEHRNFCEVCDLIHPDVENYKHKNPTIDAEWICAACADKEMIDDKFRTTHQSDFARSGRFRREFGATRAAADFKKAKQGNFGKERTPNSHNKNKNHSKSNQQKKKPKGDNFGNC